MALGDGPGTAGGVVALAGPTPRSDVIVATVDLLLRSAGVTPSELGAVVVTRGPGSFTGIRVALATAQGIAMGAGVPAHGFCSLLAQAARTDLPHVLAVQPARRGEAYTQAFSQAEGDLQPTYEPGVRTLASLAGTAVPVVAPAGFELPPGIHLASARRSTAEALLLLAASLPACDSETLVPVYLDLPPAVPPRRGN